MSITGGISLRQWAELRGVSYPTANRWFHAGQLPCRAEQSTTGRREILVFPDEPAEDCTCVDPLHVQCIVDKLRTAGYVVLSREDATRLGVPVSPL
jgi:hypothetical protein